MASSTNAKTSIHAAASYGEPRTSRWTPMTHTSDPDSPHPRSPLEFPDGLTVDERAERWAEVLAHEERLTDASLDAALFALMQRSRETS